MRAAQPALIAILLTPLVAASAPAQPQSQSLEQALSQARSEQAAAEAETARLEKAAAAARDEAHRLHAERAAAATAIDAAEARITAADAQFRLAAAYVAAHRQRLAAEQQPASSLLAGLALMARRPPLIALTDEGGTRDLVKVSVLMDATLPVIRARTRAISAQLAEGQKLEKAALTARAELVRSKEELGSRREHFARLEREATEQAIAAGGRAISAGDTAIAAAEEIERLRGQQSSSLSAQQVARLLRDEPTAPPRPFASAGDAPQPPFAYALAVKAPVVHGLGSVDDSGVRSRGVTFATVRGAGVIAPADGIIRFSGPFRDYDGIVIIDHGQGWMSLIVNVGSTARVGDRVGLGDPLGRALGRLEVQLSHNGRRFSPALIAGSSQSLSKGNKRG